MAVVVVASAAYAVSWSADGTTASDEPAPSAAGPTLSPTRPSTGAPTQPSTPPSTPPGDGSALALGETFSGSRASSTVERVKILPAPAGLEAPDGQVWYGLFVERCASETTSSATAPWSRWVVVNEQGGQYPGGDSVPDGIVERRLTTRDFGAGQCRSGWVVIGVPQGAARSIDEVRFVPPSGPSASWLV